ncbi:hypothetical protein ALQ08_101906 [Pseudomonas syringae pv. delphinii]|uniref:Uncharacterized protein n=2 Tax=Pseudomonas syringae group genomosp. 3 TaxID=251701 RepID=A0A0P9PS56_9PSED|nr:hypothetical protein ALO72_101486 [Pseudomonas syringae pv. delphinii]RMR33155.1 hypothetical protein ALP87_100994 [Pseudomonas syringae pv. coriandricola]RMT37999.1 hypothetical protein ALP50_101202 [Pseudomonas syringae pv. spinaceae]RMV02142.1 hypothetical protein ALP19_100860 [Pseudomonas syringae pv. tomato]RMP12384.1 hypothetical protein ALQ28_101757 [Pseudomonas syringae pv. delphinii]
MVGRHRLNALETCQRYCFAFWLTSPDYRQSQVLGPHPLCL